MNPLRVVAYWAVTLFFLALIARLIIDWIQVFNRRWKPKGAMLIVAEIVYTVTDPPLKLLRRFLPPVRMGAISLDMAFMVLFVLVMILRSIIL